MKLFFRIIFKIFLIIPILAGYATTEEIKETDSDALLNQCIVLLEEGQHDLSIKYFNKAIDLNPRYAEASNNRGNAYANKGQYDKAISDYTKAIDLNPRFAEAYYNRGVVYFYKRDYEKAWDDVHKVQNLGNNVHPEFLKALREASGRQK